MPVNRCNRNGEDGWKWGESGKCYIPSEEGSDGKAKRAAILQGIAIEGIDSEEIKNLMITGDFEMNETAELARILDVPVLTAGEFVSHNAGAVVVSEDELDEIIEGSNELQPIIRKAIESGVYEGNEELTGKLTKPIPGLLNLKHQAILPQTMKDATKGVATSFRKAAINGKNWIVQRFENVPPDIAATLQSEYPFRSVELLPLMNPTTGKTYSKVIRSTAFLDKFTPPAVPGQTPNLIVEFAGANEPLLTLTTRGVNIMPDTIKTQAVDVSELQTMKDTLTAQTARLAELQAKFEAAEAEKAKAIELARKQEEAKNAKIAELQAKQDELENDRLIAELSRVRNLGDNAYQVTPAFLEIATKTLRKGGAVELAEGQNQRQAMAGMLEQIVELATKNAILLPLGVKGEKSYKQPEQKPDKQAMIQELMKSEGISENQAWIRVTEQLGEYKGA